MVNGFFIARIKQATLTVVLLSTLSVVLLSVRNSQLREFNCELGL